jgi:methionyl-tRNA formyltransferase
MGRKRVCVLGYDRSQTRIVEAIQTRGSRVDEISEKVDSLAEYDVVVSFGYRHILRSDLLQSLKRPAVNLHIAYLPHNRGAHPNLTPEDFAKFFSYFEPPSDVPIPIALK